MAHRSQRKPCWAQILSASCCQTDTSADQQFRLAADRRMDLDQTGLAEAPLARNRDSPARAGPRRDRATWNHAEASYELENLKITLANRICSLATRHRYLLNAPLPLT